MMRALVACAALLAGCAAPHATPPPAANKAPDFTLTDSDGHEVTLSKLLVKGPVILAFFPKAFTGG